MTDFLLRHGWPLLASIAVKSVCVVALAGGVAPALRRSSAAARHLVWRLALFGLLLLPLFSFLPGIWQVPLASRALLVPSDAPIVTPDPDMAPTAPNSGGAGLPPAPDNGGVGEVRAAPVPSPPQPEAGGHSLPWPLWLCILWLVGCVLALLPTLIGLAGVGRLARRSSPVTDGPLLQLTASLARELGVTKPVRLLTGEAGTPMTWGWLRPVILLPPGADGWPADRLRAVLLHELAHIARADWPAQMASHLACALYWFNPLVWLAARQARLEGERACDDRVLLAGIPAPDYARHLLDVARSVRETSLPTALPLVNADTLKARLQIILDTVRKRGEVGKRLNITLTQATVWSMYSLSLLAFVVPSPPNRNVRLDVQSYRSIGEANTATASLNALRADFHASVSFTYAREGWRNNGTLTFQRPNLARIEVPGVNGWSVESDGQRCRMVSHDGSYNGMSLPVDWNGDNISSDDESLPFVQYFFRPQFHRLGTDLVEDTDSVFFLHSVVYLPDGNSVPIPVWGRYLGVKTWHGSQYQVVEFSRNIFPHGHGYRNVTTVYVGSDHLVHRIVGQDFFGEGIRTDDVWLTGIQTNQLLPRTAFRLPADNHSGT